MERAALLRAAAARVIDQHVAHDAGGDGEEMATVCEIELGRAGHAQISFVHDGGAGEGGLRRFELQVVARHALKLVVDERHELLKRGLVAPAPTRQKVGALPPVDLVCASPYSSPP